tara:strand:- start:1340 stop:1555 length:216 start_codon:yes stop_codon:yes gene_type:complete
MVTKEEAKIIDIPTTVKIYNGKTGQVYNNKSAVKADIDDTKTETTSKDIKQDVTIEVPRLPDLINRTLQKK